MSDREKRIAEIREWHEGKRDSFPQFTVFEAIGVMLDEIDRIEREYAEERAAHNALVAGLCELEQERNMCKASSEVFYERLKKVDEERQKLIEGLRWYAGDQYGSVRFWPPIPDIPILHDCGQRARDILKECGVTKDA